MIIFARYLIPMDTKMTARAASRPGQWKRLLWLLAGVVVWQACTPKAALKEEDIVRMCEETDKNLTTYTLKSTDGYPDPDKRKFMAYYKDKKPRMMVEEYYSDTARVFTRYYLDGDQLILVYQEHYGYNRPQYLTEDSARKLGDTVWYDDRKTVLQTNTCLFRDNKLQKWVGTHKAVVPSTDAAYKPKEEELLGNCLLMLKVFKTQEDK
jgi:hypothetical protein